MRKLVFVLAILCCFLLATTVSAQATRTWVSGVGDDVNPCSRTAPCKTFAGAISKTAACGEIDALDPGGFGTVTITKSITINGMGTMASILNSGGISGVLINITNAADICQTVILRWLSINGGAANGVIGANGVRDISTTAHSVHIEHVDIAHQQRGVDVNTNNAGSRMFMKDVDIRHTTTHGIDARPTAGAGVLLKLNLDEVRSRQSSGDALRLANNTAATVRESSFEGSNNGVNVVANTIFSMFIDSNMSNNNATGLVNGSTATTTIDGCTINGNNTGILNNTGGNVISFANSAIAGNNFDVTGTAVTTGAHP
jgi:hypothetical protein